ncbi:MAG TPA: substrate-binding and VWA domain-containing protein, partial [Rubrivivax sp.]|nr:substrate-binding and VWA domain-containing protein [Rubrivivax sp.]
MVAAAATAGVTLKMHYAGTLDIVERINAGEQFDAVLPASGAYPSLALTEKPIAREKLFYSRVALGIKQAKLSELGWHNKPPTWSDVATAAAGGKLRFGMTNPTSSNSGMAALFAVASAGAGKTEDLAVNEVDEKLIQRFLQGQHLTAGSSGWLAQAFVQAPGVLDGMVNYESVILRANATLTPADKLVLVYPQDGVISADYPLLLLKGGDRGRYDKLVGALKAPAFQTIAANEGFLRPSISEVPLAAGLSSAAVAELSFPNRLEVIDAVLGSYQDKWRRPATSIFVLDISGSMKGERIGAMRSALKILAGAQPETASARYARFQNRERVALVPFDDRVDEPVWVDFDKTPVDQARQATVKFADALEVRGGTAIYQALMKAQ